ncbi:hypothetical protein SIPHO058v2_p0015 [Vibrio phage 14E30.2]|nr:hypothetical protein SIPHO058v2_p0015 [Vibrio phage 14E30.2]
MTIFDLWEGFEVACVVYTSIKFIDYFGGKFLDLILGGNN